MSDLVFSDLYPVKNRLKGIIPTASSWDTPPDHLERCTDLDWDTPTGTGSKTLSASGDYGYLDFDMGAEYKVMLRGKVGIWSTAGSVYLILNIWDTVSGGWSNQPYAICYKTTTSEVITPWITHNFKAQKLRLEFYCNAAATCYAKIYEVQAIDLGLP